MQYSAAAPFLMVAEAGFFFHPAKSAIFRGLQLI